MTWICVETGRTVRNVPWLRFKLWAWKPLVRRFNWPHRICRHYVWET